jgi:hypothetical protein
MGKHLKLKTYYMENPSKVILGLYGAAAAGIAIEQNATRHQTKAADQKENQ